MPTVHKYVVIGTGPGGCACAKTLSMSGKQVLMLERGTHKKYGNYGLFSTTLRLLSLKSVRSDNDTCCNLPFSGYKTANVVGGGSAVNFGLWFAPSVDDLKHALPSSMRTEDLMSEFLATIDTPACFRGAPQTPLQKEVIRALRPYDRERRFDVLDGLRRSHRDAFTHCGQLKDPNTNKHTNLHTRLVASEPAIETWTSCTVERITVDPKNSCWCLKTNRGDVHCNNVFLACGAIESPALLMRSFPNELCPMVGRGLQDHVLESCPVPTTSKMNRDNTLGSAVPIHGADADGTSSATSEVAELPFCAAAFGRAEKLLVLNQCVRRTVSCAPSSFWCCCCYPDLRIQFFAPTEADGRVTIDRTGRPYVHAPTVSGESQESLTAFFRRTMNRLRSVPEILVDHARRAPQVTSWHYVGTVAAPTSDSSLDGGVNSRCQVLGRDSRPICENAVLGGGIFVADASLARRVSTHNTQSLAAYAGFVAAKKATRSS